MKEFEKRHKGGVDCGHCAHRANGPFNETCFQPRQIGFGDHGCLDRSQPFVDVFHGVGIIHRRTSSVVFSRSSMLTHVAFFAYV